MTLLDRPVVSIGMPVYNEERYLARALESLLSQDFKDFELIICDNASQDATGQIARHFESWDSRVRYHRNEANLGAENFNRVFMLSRAKYFMWAAADDLWAPTHISRCLEVLDSDPSVALVYPLAVLMDDEGQKHGIMGARVDTRGCVPVQRFYAVLLNLTVGSVIYGLIRSDSLRKTRLFRPMLGSDIVVLSELSLLGAFAHIPEPLFYRRWIRKGESKERRERRWIEQVEPRSIGRRVLFPYWRLYSALMAAAWGAPLDLRRRIELVVGVGLFSTWTYRYGLVRPWI
jgi:glycosyltransferase involved in cell wall biosynthesis